MIFGRYGRRSLKRFCGLAVRVHGSVRQQGRDCIDSRSNPPNQTSEQLLHNSFQKLSSGSVRKDQQMLQRSISLSFSKLFSGALFNPIRLTSRCGCVAAAQSKRAETFETSS